MTSRFCRLPRAGMGVDIAGAGTSLVELQTAGRWKSPGMSAHYTRAQRAAKGAVARYYAAQAAETRDGQGSSESPKIVSDRI